MSQEIAALTALCVSNTELDQLEGLLAEFNVFEAAGMTRDELKHSRFLSFLLNPKEVHGLGDQFLTKLLQMAIQGSGRNDLDVSPLELELWDLSASEVRVEWSSIDILILNHEVQVAIIIENKIGSGEHSEQLTRYLANVHASFPGWRTLPLLLSPSGTPPSDDRYIPVTYESVVDQLSALSQRVGPSVQVAIQHYTQLLRRHVVSDSKVKELCQQIYRRHKKALDLIYSYREDENTAVVRLVSEFLRAQSGIKCLKDKELSTDFLPDEWLPWVPNCGDSTWLPGGQMLGFWFHFGEKGLRLMLDIGPGDRAIARKMLEAAWNNKPPFLPQSKTVNQKWNRIYIRLLIPGTTLASGDQGAIADGLESGWRAFAETDLTKLGEVLRAASAE